MSGHDRSAPDSTVQLKYGSLPYIEGLTQSFTRLFSQYKIANYNNKKLNLFNSRLKDPVPLEKNCNAIYGIPCECGKIYIGHTSQRLSKRLALHISDCKPKPLATSLSIHVNENDHRVLYDEAIILDRAEKEAHRKILEICYIV
ncbi:uncharacterized protein [Diabrotica undecimpunctata]|uniref:uncharacterized protein n=1 Tax=Diabrotica undecimpunctata TaxID=50387 RepID=UPI003B63E987